MQICKTSQTLSRESYGLFLDMLKICINTGVSARALYLESNATKTVIKKTVPCFTHLE
jgi:hypothetical protein